MHASRGLLSVVSVALFSALALTPRSASADTYTLHTVDWTESSDFYAGNDLGQFVINVSNASNHPCGLAAAHCYEVGSVGKSSMHYTTTAPVLGAGESTVTQVPSHPVLGAGWDVSAELGGIFAATYTSPTMTMRGIFDGTDAMHDYLGTGSIDGGLISKGGNVYFINGLDDSLEVALNSAIAPAPEPGSLVLLGSGAAGLLAAFRRRRLA